MDLSISIDKKNTGKFVQKARFGQSITRKFALQEISNYIKNNKDFGDTNYLIYESVVLSTNNFFDCKPIYIDMNKIYKY